MGFNRLALFLSAALLLASAEASNYQTLEGIAHEAYLMSIGDTVTLESVKQTPPQPVTEHVPEPTVEGAVWIPGYWSLDIERQDFIWVGGVWRKPPPEHKWVPGYWKRFPTGWVRLPGFWNQTEKKRLEFIEQAPPTPIEEETGQSPEEDYFWAKGHWTFDKETQEYQWSNGRWERLDPNWILVPAHYSWRPGGYVLIPAYWDWTLEERGIPYASIFVPKSNRSHVVYEPTIAIDPSIVTRRAFFWYPNYSYFFAHDNYFNPEFWVSFRFAPPWWKWNSWWSLNLNDQWALWWWWSNPGYAAPQWMTSALSRQLTPPPLPLVGVMKDVFPPAIVTPEGVVTQNELLAATKEITPTIGNKPILPANPTLLLRIQTAIAIAPSPDLEGLRPSGRGTNLTADMPKPEITTIGIPNKYSESESKTPNKPKLPNSRFQPTEKKALLPPIEKAPRENLQKDLYEAPKPRERQKRPTTFPYIRPMDEEPLITPLSANGYERRRPGYRNPSGYTPAKPEPYRTQPPRHERFKIPDRPRNPSTTTSSPQPWSGIDSPLDRQKDRIEAPRFRLEGEPRLHQNQSVVEPLPREESEDD